MILIFLLPHCALFWLHNFYKIGKRPAKGAFDYCDVVHVFYLKRMLAMFSVLSFKKCSEINRSETGQKPLINAAWPLTSQTRAYQQDLETNPETTLTCLRVEHQKQNWKTPY